MAVESGKQTSAPPQVYGSLPDGTSTLNSCDLERGPTSQASQGDLTSKINAFNNQRREERLRMYSYVVWTFKVQLFCGQFLFVAAIAARMFLGVEPLALVIMIIANFNTASSIVVLSTCPHDLLSIDEMARKLPKTLVAFNVALAFVPLMRVLFVFPHLDGLLVIVCIFSGSSTWSRWPSWWPATTTFMTLYLVLYGVSRGSEYFFPETNQHEFSHPAQYAIAGWYQLVALFLVCTWWRRVRYSADKNLARGMAFYEGMYAMIVAEGVNWCVTGVAEILGGESLEGGLAVAIGAALLTPPLLLLLLGRTRLFQLIGRSFDRDGARLRKDGAFIAELLDNIPVNVGQLWWVHREIEDERYVGFDHRRKWQRGTVTEVVSEKEFLVQIQEDSAGGAALQALGIRASQGPQQASRPSIAQMVNDSLTTKKMQFPSLNGGKQMEELLLEAQKGLRCVDFEALTPELCRREDSRNNPELQAKWYGLSRPVKSGEQIDFFMSNSWYDDPDTKWNKLCEVAENFRKKNGRYPTIWLDKLCIDQTAITDGLKVLSVNVMACSKLLVLCGDTYMSRLWCIWELFTLFAFVPEAVALERIEFVFLGDYEKGLTMLKAMSNFHVKDAHCYDPNEEGRLLQVIDAVGTDRFNKRIAAMAKLTVSNLEKQRNRSRSWRKSKPTEEIDAPEGVSV